MALTGTALALTGNNSTNAQFRAWGQNVSSTINSCGMIQTSDTGQINWATVTAPAGANTIQGYEVWRFADALQASAPVYFKLEYGSGSTANNPSLNLILGSGSDGLGNLTGITMRENAACSGTAGNTTCYVCGDTNRLTLALFVAGANATAASCLVHMLERTVDAAGVLTAEGVLYIGRGTSVWQQQAWNCKTGPMSAQEVTLGCMGPSIGNGGSGANTSVYPIYHTKGIFLNPGYNMFGGFEANFPANITTTFTVYGVSHTYMPMSQVNASAPVFRTVSSTSNVLLRYD